MSKGNRKLYFFSEKKKTGQVILRQLQVDLKHCNELLSIAENETKRKLPSFIIYGGSSMQYLGTIEFSTLL